MKRLLFFLIFFFPSFIFAQYTANDVYNYLDQYHRLATDMMKETKIPASIKLAQAIYISGAGTSPLSKKSNNHFGILCGNDWDGATYTDPTTQICYRAYTTVESAYRDHARFLKERSRYNRLFFLDITDYKAWAIALQEAGYSENPQYAQKIIEIIETYYLHLYDKDGVTTPETPKAQSLPDLSQTSQNEVEKEIVEQKRQEELEREKAEERRNREEIEKMRLEEERRIKEAEEKAWEEFETKEQAKMRSEKEVFEKKAAEERRAFEERQRLQYDEAKKTFAERLKTGMAVDTAVATLEKIPAEVEKEPAPVMKRDTIVESGIEVIINRQLKPKATPAEETKPAQETVKHDPVKSASEPAKSTSPKPEESAPSKIEPLVFKAKEFEYKPVYYAFTTRNVYENNKTKFVITQRGDTYAKIAKDVQLSEENLRNYNDIFENTYEPVPGEVVYISQKKSQSSITSHMMQKGETMRYVAQKYAIPLKMIYKRNGYSTDAFAEGETVCITCKK